MTRKTAQAFHEQCLLISKIRKNYNKILKDYKKSFNVLHSESKTMSALMIETAELALPIYIIQLRQAKKDLKRAQRGLSIIAGDKVVKIPMPKWIDVRNMTHEQRKNLYK